MKKLVVLLTVITFIGCQKNETPQKNNLWKEDIEFIQINLPDKHVNLFTKISSQEFNSEIESLIEKLPTLEENEIICGLMKIFAKIGDPHTGIHNESNMSRFNIAPVKFEVFDDGIYLVGAIESGDAFLRKKVTAVNNTPINIVCEKIAEIIPHENDYFVKSSIPNILRLYEVIEALDVGDSDNSYYLNLENVRNTLVRGSSSNANFISCYENDKTPLYLVNNDRNYWYKIIDNNIVYLQYNKCFDVPDNPFLNFIQSMFEELKDQQIDKFIIDLRLNSGGSSLVISPLVDELKKHDELNGKIYCCIGCQTFSSGLLNAIQLKEELGAKLVGEPTGGKPNSFGEVKELILPNCKIFNPAIYTLSWKRHEYFGT